MLERQKGVMAITLRNKTVIRWLDFKSHSVADFFFFHISLQFPSKLWCCIICITVHSECITIGYDVCKILQLGKTTDFRDVSSAGSCRHHRLQYAEGFVWLYMYL